MNSPDLLSTLQAIEAEAKRALNGLADGSIPRGSKALTNVRYLAADALAEVEERRLDFSEEGARTP